MTRATDNQLPVFDRSGQASLSTPDDARAGGVVGQFRTIPADDLPEGRAQAEHNRPDVPDETVEGLDDTDEEVRRQAEDLSLDTAGSL